MHLDFMSRKRWTAHENEEWASCLGRTVLVCWAGPQAVIEIGNVNTDRPVPEVYLALNLIPMSVVIVLIKTTPSPANILTDLFHE